jgi:limonene-1,2-epoxide hydrolase
MGEQSVAFSIGSYSSCMETAAEVVQEFVDRFVAAWPTGDATTVAALFSEDASYHNGPLDPVYGRDAIQATLSGFMAMGGSVTVDMVHVLADDRVVMTERIDHFMLDDRTISLPVMGIFGIQDRRIIAWRDYFDLNQFAAALASGD